MNPEKVYLLSDQENHPDAVTMLCCPDPNCFAEGFTCTTSRQDVTSEDHSPYYQPNGYPECWNCGKEAVSIPIPPCLCQVKTVDGIPDVNFFPTNKNAEWVKKWEIGQDDLPESLCDPVTGVFK